MPNPAQKLIYFVLDKAKPIKYNLNMKALRPDKRFICSQCKNEVYPAKGKMYCFGCQSFVYYFIKTK